MYAAPPSPRQRRWRRCIPPTGLTCDRAVSDRRSLEIRIPSIALIRPLEDDEVVADRCDANARVMHAVAANGLDHVAELRLRLDGSGRIAGTRRGADRRETRNGLRAVECDTRPRLHRHDPHGAIGVTVDAEVDIGARA